MSLYLVPSATSSNRLQSVARELTYPGKHCRIKVGAPGWVWVGDDPARFAPATDDTSGVTVISSGRLAWSTTQWSRAARLPYEGGLANRLVLERYLSRGADAVAPYNGSAVIAISDPRDGKLHVWTDQFGYHPCFIYRADEPSRCIVTTFPDALLADGDVSLTDDLVGMAEFIRAWRVTPPHTYYGEVKHAGSAAHFTIDPRAQRLSKRCYWVPFESGFFPSIHAAAEELAAAVRTSILERTVIAERPLMFVSGGADSRVMLFSAADPQRITGVNLYERAAIETELARRLCEAAGSKFEAFQRDNDFYPRTMAESVRWSGAMWSTEDAHYPGFGEQIAQFAPDLVMTACTTDWVFKGYGLEKSYASLFKRALPFNVYTNRRIDAFLPNWPQPAPTALGKLIDERMAQHFAGTPTDLVTPLDRLLVEDRRVRPAAYTVSVSGQIMYRTFPYDTFLADSRIADCYSRIHPDWKLNREVWGKAAARICQGASDVVDSNYGWKVDASPPGKAVAFARGWIGRRLQRVRASPAAVDDRPPSSGSWPVLGWYARHSETLRHDWSSASSEHREKMRFVCGDDPWRRPLESWSDDEHRLFRMMTLLQHWRERKARLRRARLNSVPTD